MNIADKFPKIEVLFTYDRFITILKQVTVSLMATIIGNSITGQNPAHVLGKTRWAATKKDMGMVGHQRPGID
jgi:hypothetical protein